MSVVNQKTIDLYVKAIDLAKEQKNVSEQSKILLNQFKMILLGGSIEDANKEFAAIGKIKKSTLHRIRELVGSVFEDKVLHSEADRETQDRMLKEGNMRADMAEDIIRNNLIAQGLLICERSNGKS